MKHRMMWFACALLLLPMIACQEETPVSPAVELQASVPPYADPQQIALAIMASAGWPAEDEAGNPVELESPAASPDKCPLEFVGRQVIVGDVAHYEFRLSVGPGQYDVIGLHRVVRERSPFRPIKTHANLFLQHGDYKSFAGCYLPGWVSPRQPDDAGFAVFLAENDVDVWGIDQAWCLVPAAETDLSFMADWDMQRQVDDLLTAVNAARHARRMSGNGFQKMLLSGYSTGGPIGFALLNQETQLPPGRRSVSGFIPVDQGLKTDDPVWAEVCQGICANYQAMLDGGQYQDNNPLPIFGDFALNDPAGESPLVPGVNNLQAALILGTLPFFPGVAAHFFAGIFDEGGLPTALRFASTDDWVDFLYYAPPYEPAAYLRDEYMPNYTDETPYDDHLGEITVPVLFVAARGGFGPVGVYTLELLGSQDTSILEASWGTDDLLLEYGHIDLFLANDAETQIWQPVLAWIRGHTPGGPH